jgi:DNA-binding NtrC family response regulator
VRVLNVLYLTTCRKNARELHRVSYGSWKVRWLSNPDALDERIESGFCGIVLVDVAMTGVYVPDILDHLSACTPRSLVFLLSREYSSVFQKLSERYRCAGYVQMSRSGYPAYTKLNRYLSVVAPARERHSATYGCSSDESPGEPPDESPGVEREIARTLLGPSHQMRRVRHDIAVIRGFIEPVLITGESGTGKDIVARLVHRYSPVSDGPLQIINMSCLPEGIVESLLFGTKRGCYTGVGDNPGLIELSNGGTLFLDEIGDLPLPLQPKLLRVLEEGTVRRLGSDCDRAVSFRLICATNKALAREASAGGFREDLMYRIDVLRIHIPPLRERPDDIPALLASTLDQYGKTLSLSALDALMRHPWNGNVRELRHCVARAACACEGPVIQDDQILF